VLFQPIPDSFLGREKAKATMGAVLKEREECEVKRVVSAVRMKVEVAVVQRVLGGFEAETSIDIHLRGFLARV
jgi:hypothetical protein